ncbi:MAG: asparagine synthase (glutamine-hydrolyzing) [Alphaproteobacteria bacterium]
MCGIAGLMTGGGTSPPALILDALTTALAHRGPDGHGRHMAGNVGLIQTRLAIIDLATGDQPFLAADGTALVANGEIYNDLELRAEMAPDTRFATGSDCEPPLHLYRRLGVSFADRLRGMYAIAIHDPGTGRLVLARDPFGIKPLYIAESGAGFAFASEPQALIAAGLASPHLRRQSVLELLQLQFTTGEETPFADIRRVLPGETLVVEGGRIVARHRRAALPSGEEARFLDEAEALAGLEAVLNDSIGVHRRADVPYGLFLSGGIDSSVVLAMMARQGGERPVLAFTAAFPGTAAHDEREAARAVARAVGADSVEVEFTEADFWSSLPMVAAAMDDPAADYAILPTFRLAAEARKSVKVILSGEGGDELFGGYGRYRAAMRPWPFTRKMRRRGTFDGLGVLREPTTGWRDGIGAAERDGKREGHTRLQRAQALDCADWLPNDLLNKLDRCLMAHGVEGRVPFLDPVVAEFAFQLPDRLKIRKSLGKWLPRRWLAMELPAARPFARKRGFTVPVGEWIAKAGRRLGPLVAVEPGIEELCRPDRVVALFADAGKQGFAAWTLLYYALWHRRHVLGKLPEGDVFETLGG